MEKLKELSLAIKMISENGNREELQEQVILFNEYLLQNFMNPSWRAMNKEDLRNFEYCTLALEFEWLHLNVGSDICFVIKEICNQYPELQFLRKRIICLRYPDQISDIERDWEHVLKSILEEFLILDKMSPSLLSVEGKRIFLDRCGIKVMNQISAQLERLNLRGQLPVKLTDLLRELDPEAKYVARVLTWTAQNNTIGEFKRELIDI